MSYARYVVSLLALGLVLSCGQGQSPDADQPSGGESAAPAVHDSLVVELIGKDSVSVFDLLRADHEVNHYVTAMGVFVRAIDSVENSSTACWIYTVNDSMIDLASNHYITADSDLVKWHYRIISR
ncbi:MAG: DUF4430 domain-containing protein [candidate division Zixibacteria bacterium]|nr:DUF4430 domain-containing protein [candidate division Zixibacteria bacterium]